MKTIIKYTSLLSFVVLGALMIVGVLNFADVFQYLGVAGATHLMAAAAGVTTENMSAANSDVLLDPFEKMMTIMKPDDYPMDQLIRNTKKAYSWKAWKVTYPAVETRPITDTTAGSSTSAVADATTPGTVAVTVTNITQWLVDDIVRFNGVTGGDTNATDFTGQIVSKSGNTFTIYALNGLSTNGNGIPIIPTGTTITRLGNAKDETAAENAIYNAVPETAYNYMQIRMGQIEESILYKMHAKNIEYDQALQRLLAMYNFRNEAELTALFGKRSMKVDPVSGKTKYVSGGAEFFIENTFTYGTAENPTKFGASDWTSLCKNIFTGNSGSSRRVMFAGKDLIERIANIDTVSRQLNANDSTEIVWGVRFSKVKDKFGELLVKHHKMLDFAGYAGKAMVIDINNVDKYTFEPFQKTPMDYDKTGSKRVESERFHETSCHVFKYPDTHAIITPHA